MTALLPDILKSSFHLEETHLSFLSGLTFDTWAGAVQELARLTRCSAWWLGDALVVGEAKFGEDASQIESELGHDYQYLADLKWVAKRIPPEDRSPSLSWSHHRELAKFEPAQREQWLTKAESEGWTRTQLRHELRDQGLLPPAKSMTDVEFVKKSLDSMSELQRIEICEYLSTRYEAEWNSVAKFYQRASCDT